MSDQFLRDGAVPFPAYLVSGSDAGLVSQQLSALLSSLGALDGENSAAIEEYGTTTDEPTFVAAALDACRTPPFFTERRVVVIRDASAMDATDVALVVGYLNEPLETTVVVMGHVGRSAPAALSKAVKANGLVIGADPPTNVRGRGQWFAEHLANSNVRLDHDAAELLQDHLGEDLARLEGILQTLRAAFGETSTIHAGDLLPYLGSAGAVAPWDLTDAVDAGDADGAISALHRLMSGGERHALAVLATLNRHFEAMLRLDGAEAMDEQGAAEATGLSPFPAKKALAQARRLGHERLARAIELLSEADLDLRGRIGWPPELVMEVLVGRLCQLARMARSTRSRPVRAQRRA